MDARARFVSLPITDRKTTSDARIARLVLDLAGRLRRGELECKETRYGFLANQVKGWDGEFQRLQAFTGMDSKYTPGENHIVDEITNQKTSQDRLSRLKIRKEVVIDMEGRPY